MRGFGLKLDRGWKLALSCAVVFLLQPVFAADLAILSNGFSIRHDHRVVMGTMTRLFLSADGSSFTDVPTAQIVSFEKDLSPPPAPDPPAAVPKANAAASTHPALALPPALAATRSTARVNTPRASAAEVTTVVNSASEAYHLDPDLVNSVIHAESGFNSHAVSPKGAQGLMQLMPQTANNLGVSNAFDPKQNVGGGSQYLRELLEHYNFDLVKALAAYNAGPERVEKYNGVPPFRETRAYVAHIIQEYNQKKIAQERAEKAQALAEAKKAKAVGKAPHQAGPKNATASSHAQTAASTTAHTSTSASLPR
jgi:soluble lytic murein transglycosylase-like protein